MAFTFSHPAIVVPLARWLPLSALVAGSIAPDLVSVYALPLGHEFGHTWPGLVTFSLPAALITLLAFHLAAKQPLIALCPPRVREKLTPVASASRWSSDLASPRRCPGLILRVLAAVVLGILSHYLWDGLTHSAQWSASYPVWLQNILQVGHRSLAAVYILHFATSLLGMALIMRWIRAWLARAPMGTDQPRPWRERTRVAMLTLAGLAAALFAAWTINAHWHLSWGSDGTTAAVVKGAHAFLQALALSLGVYCAAWWLRTWSEAASTAHP